MVAPADYDAFFRDYYDYIVRLARKGGIDRDEVEDVAQTIVWRFIDKKMLEQFDGNLVFEYNGVKKPARFKSFLGSFVNKYLMGERDKQRRRKTNEVLIMDMPIRNDRAELYGSWGQKFSPLVDGPEIEINDRLHEEATVNIIRKHIATIPRRSAFDTCDLPRLLEEYVRQVRQYGDWNPKELCQMFGVSNTAMYNWITLLKAGAADALGLPAPKKRPRAR